MSSIFISHSSKDNEVAEQVKARLEKWGHRSIFLDFDPAGGIPAGRDWEKELYAQLSSCSAVIVLCSQTSMASRWCFVEIAYAKALGKHVFPIKIDDSKVDPILTAKQVINAAAGWDETYQRLETGLLAAGLDPKGMFDWDGTTPYPGLSAFQEQDAAIFFGRDKEIREGQALLNRLRQFGGPRFTLMLGVSGSGKSSLMRAGLLPRLKRDQRWVVVEPFRPLKAPFDELATVISQRFAQVMETKEGTVTDAAHLQKKIQWNEQDPKQTVDTFLELIKELREADGSREATVLLLIDQCEELLSGGANEEGDRFLAFLRAVLDRKDSCLMMLATLRSDFLGSFQDHPGMRGLRVETFPVPQMELDDFAKVIEEPARVASLELGPGLVHAMINDTKTADALPLLAFTLRELYEGFGEDKRLMLEEYRDKLGRLEGCITRAAEAVLTAEELSEKETDDLRTAFLSMVRVNGRNQYAKQPVLWNNLPTSVYDTLERFVTARLLVSSPSEKGRTLEVAHEALLRSWPKLKDWIDKCGEALRLIDFEEEAARRWHDEGAQIQGLWRRERALKVKEMLALFKKTPSSQLKILLDPRSWLDERLKNKTLSHQDRLLFGLQLAGIGDPRSGVDLCNGLPDIFWVDIPGGQIKLEGADQPFDVRPFRMAKYLVTNAQFEAFLNAVDGYQNDEWWRGGKQPDMADPPTWREANAPRENVARYEAIAFCRWLSRRTETSIRLPTEWEWQQAATGGDPMWGYPWKGEWDATRCNSDESQLSRTTAVGMYPHGATQQGVLDMVGNLWEWCVSQGENLVEPELSRLGTDRRVIRGGSWYSEQGALCASSRDLLPYGYRSKTVGFRLVQDIP